MDPTLYIKSVEGDVVILVIYVDAVIIIGGEVGAIAKIKLDLCSTFDMIYLFSSPTLLCRCRSLANI